MLLVYKKYSVLCWVCSFIHEQYSLKLAFLCMKDGKSVFGYCELIKSSEEDDDDIYFLSARLASADLVPCLSLRPSTRLKVGSVQ